VSTGHNTKLRVVGAAGMLAVLAACGSGGSGNNTSGSTSGGQVKGGPGVDTAAKTIALGVLSPLSGPVAVIGKPLTNGQAAYFNSVNAGGGIDGYKVNLVERDDQYNPQQHVQFFNEIEPNVAMIAQSLGSPTTLAIQSAADSKGIVIGAATQSSSWVTDKVMAVIGTPYAIDVANGLHYIVHDKGETHPRIGIIYQDDEYGQDGLRGYTTALKTYHFDSVARATYRVDDTDLTAQVQKMRSAGAQYVFVIGVPGAGAKLVGTGASQGYNPTWVFQGPAWSEYLMSADGTTAGKPTPVAGALASNVWVLGYEAQWGDKSVPGMGKFLADTKRFAPAQIPDYYFMYGYAMAQMETAVLRKAIASGDLSRQGIVDAKLHLGSVNLGGLVPQINYTPALGPVSRMSGISRVSASTPGFLTQLQGYFTGTAAKSMHFEASR
jgi:ABC-type branched-subunit amino acid transport system substrate-binding protein